MAVGQAGPLLVDDYKLMAVRTNPTNADLLREIKDVKGTQESMQKSLNTVTSDVDNLKVWRIAQEAVEAYKRDENKPSGAESKLNKDVVKQILYALTAVCIALIAVTQAGSK
jgi:hypothetical protein